LFRKKFIKYTLLLAFIIAILTIALINNNNEDEKFVTYKVDLKKQSLKLYWKDDTGELLKSLNNLKNYLNKKGETLLFAMNAGMYKKDNSPQGLFIVEQKIIVGLDTTTSTGNFYLKPNGVFYITNNAASICTTEKFVADTAIKYATQSGPMLVIDGQIHTAFKENSTNINIRNGVGILPTREAIFVMSKKEINFYNFANYFKKLGCKNALYLDGFVSRTYLPEKNWVQLDGNFGVMIGVTSKK
jgi:uncharacterized protein YigE (DUF2233 family)